PPPLPPDECALSLHGARPIYPSTEVLMCGYSYDGEPAKVLVGHEEIIRILGDDLVDPKVTKIAHNTGFDRVVLSGMLGMPVGHRSESTRLNSSHDSISYAVVC